LLPLTHFQFVVDVLIVAAGSILLMWIGELITEFGIGNGVSLIIFAGIVARIPSGIAQTLFTATTANIPAYLGFLALALAVVYAVVVVADAERSIPIAYARQMRGRRSADVPSDPPPSGRRGADHLRAFASALPQLALAGARRSARLLRCAPGSLVPELHANTWLYSAVYFVLVVIFTYLYTAITFEPHRVADNLQKSGAFVPGVRPGRETQNYIGYREPHHASRRRLPRYRCRHSVHHPRAYGRHGHSRRRYGAPHRRAGASGSHPEARRADLAPRILKNRPRRFSRYGKVATCLNILGNSYSSSALPVAGKGVLVRARSSCIRKSSFLFLRLRALRARKRFMAHTTSSSRRRIPIATRS
jgi:hypothetical protein